MKRAFTHCISPDYHIHRHNTHTGYVIIMSVSLKFLEVYQRDQISSDVHLILIRRELKLRWICVVLGTSWAEPRKTGHTVNNRKPVRLHKRAELMISAQYMDDVIIEVSAEHAEGLWTMILKCEKKTLNFSHLKQKPNYQSINQENNQLINRCNSH